MGCSRSRRLARVVTTRAPPGCRAPARFDEQQLPRVAEGCRAPAVMPQGRACLCSPRCCPAVLDAHANRWRSSRRAACRMWCWPEDARPLVEIVFGGPHALGPRARAAGGARGGTGYFSYRPPAAAAKSGQRSAGHPRARCAPRNPGRKGESALYIAATRWRSPVREHGPELAPLLRSIARGLRRRERLARFA